MVVVRAAEEEEEEEEEDPHLARRRVPGKMTLRSMKKEDEEEYDKVLNERKMHEEKISNIILEESVIALKDEMKVMDVIFEELKKVKSAVTQEDEPVLRTRVVSPRERLQEAPKWDEAIKKMLPIATPKKRKIAAYIYIYIYMPLELTQFAFAMSSRGRLKKNSRPQLWTFE